MTVSLLSFQVEFFFISFSCLIVVAQTSNTILNKKVKMGILILFLISEGMLSAFTIEYDVSYGVIIYGLYYVEVYSLYVHFLESFYHKWMLNFVKSFFFFFFASFEMIIWLLFFSLLMWYITLIDLWISKNPFIWDKSHLIMMCDPFNVFLNLVC